MHHLHISTPALLVILLFTLAIIAVIFGFVASMRRDRRAAEVAIARAAQRERLYQEEYPVGGPPYTSSGAPVPNYGRCGMRVEPVYAPAPVIHPSPVYAPAPMVGQAYGMDPGLAMVEGMLIGEALSSHHHHDTVVTNTYVDSYPSYSPSYDSGISYSSSDSYSSSSSDYSSGGGVDISW
jgi:hypothetical protein